LWGFFVAPRATIVLPAAAELRLAGAVFAAAAAGLAAVGSPALGLVLFAAFARNRAVSASLGEGGHPRLAR
jgi:hypothetical protein